MQDCCNWSGFQDENLDIIMKICKRDLENILKSNVSLDGGAEGRMSERQSCRTFESCGRAQRSGKVLKQLKHLTNSYNQNYKLRWNFKAAPQIIWCKLFWRLAFDHLEESWGVEMRRVWGKPASLAHLHVKSEKVWKWDRILIGLANVKSFCVTFLMRSDFVTENHSLSTS